MKKSSAVWRSAVAIMVVVVAALLLVIWLPTGTPNTQTRGTGPAPRDEAGGKPPAGSLSAQASAADAAAGHGDVEDSGEYLRRELRDFLRDLRAGLTRQEVLERLRDLQAAVHAAPPDTAAAAIIAELRAGEDASTGLDYAIGAEGVMEETPTYRTALLDLLGQTDPFQSSAYSRELMSITGVADEYSLALRNLAWANFEGRLDAELRDYFTAMLAREDWRRNPTTGLLEAFDVPVATGSVDQVARILESNPAPASDADWAIGRAAFVALDRLMVADPSKVVEVIRSDPELLSEAPIHRASIMSRLDVRQADQAALLRDYLSNRAHAAGELNYFAEIFPNANYFSSHRLITPWQSGLSISQVDQLDRATVQTLVSWLNDPELSPAKQQLESIITRLGNLTQTDGTSGP